MSATIQPATASSWRVLVIGSVGVLAVGIGIAAGSFLLTSRGAGGIGAGAAYVPADAPFYFEIEVEPSAEQDAALRELLGRFPAIEGLDLDRPLHDQLVELLDDQLSSTGMGMSYAEDVAPWFGGTVAVALTDIDPSMFADPMAAPQVPDVLVVASVTDAEAARATVDRLLDDALWAASELTETEHRGVTVVELDGGSGAYAITDDALLAAPNGDAIRAALDVEAEGGSLAADDGWGSMLGQLPDDRLFLAVVDATDIMAASLESSATMSGLPADTFDAFLEGQSMRGVFALSADGDLVAFDSVTEAPTGRFATSNADRGLADEVPADALYYADGGNLGGSLTALVEVMKQAAASDPAVADQIATAEAAIGAEIEDFVSWMGDGAMVAGWDGSEAYAGLVIVPTDVDEARDRLEQLAGFARLGGLDPSLGIRVEDSEVGGVATTTIRWQDPMMSPDPSMPVPTGVAIEFAVTDDRAIIGVGDRFVDRVLELDASESLGASDRFADAVDAFGGANNAGVGWLDITGVRVAIEETFLPLAGAFGFGTTYEDEIRAWLEPLDRIAFVSRLEGDLLVQRGGLLLD